ncbi:unnamed protein product, partial [Polarella glacialis]
RGLQPVQAKQRRSSRLGLTWSSSGGLAGTWNALSGGYGYGGQKPKNFPGGVPSGSAASGAPAEPTAADVDRLIARCLTHERPTALVQASKELLNACIEKLGEQ